MFKNKFLSIVVAASCAVFTACSDDDGNNPDVPGTINPSKVFTSGLPTSIGTGAITTDAQGRVTSISEDGQIVSFKYENGSRAQDYQVIMTIHEEGYSEDDETLYLTLNNQGFVSYVYETYANGNEPSEWWLTYSNDGYLTSMKRSEDEEETTITWANGNITAVKIVDHGDGDRIDNVTVSYNGQANKGCIMLYDYCFGIDMDELGLAYFAGLLGKATKDLPVSYNEDGDVTKLDWTINANGFPTKVVADYGGYTDEPIEFSWK